jgi:ferredoxin
MHRRETPGKTSGINQEPVKDTEPETARTKIQFPKVVPEKCTACGICIGICPSGAITMENEKAFVNNDLCKNCNVCIKACPEEAIIFQCRLV